MRQRAKAARCNWQGDSNPARRGNIAMSARLPPVLVVDDEKNMRLSLKTVLADENYSVRAVESAEEALTVLDRDEFFMVITDARLGGMSGYEFLAKARARWPDLPMLMITAYATPKLAVEAIHAGAIDYLAKPCEVSRKATRMHGVADKKLLFARPPVIDAARVRKNWFSLLIIPGPTLSGGKCLCKGFCLFTLGFRQRALRRKLQNT